MAAWERQPKAADFKDKSNSPMNQGMKVTSRR